jgi:hypothetical protein
MFRSLMIALSFFAMCWACCASDVTIGAASVKLDPPSGYCEMDRSLSTDSRMFSVIDSMLKISGNRLLAASADCKELSDWRTGKRKLLDHLVQYQTLKSIEDSGISGTPESVVQQACKEMRSQGEQLVADTTRDAKKQAEKVLENIRVNEMKFLGVLAEDPLGCYAGILQKFRTDIGTEKTQVNLVATTVVKNKVIYVYFIAPFTSADTMIELLANERRAISQIQSANR